MAVSYCFVAMILEHLGRSFWNFPVHVQYRVQIEDRRRYFGLDSLFPTGMGLEGCQVDGQRGMINSRLSLTRIITSFGNNWQYTYINSPRHEILTDGLTSLVTPDTGERRIYGRIGTVKVIACTISLNRTCSLRYFVKKSPTDCS
jgi:hypothetical protein